MQKYKKYNFLSMTFLLLFSFIINFSPSIFKLEEIARENLLEINSNTLFGFNIHYKSFILVFFTFYLAFIIINLFKININIKYLSSLISSICVMFAYNIFYVNVFNPFIITINIFIICYFAFLFVRDKNIIDYTIVLFLINPIVRTTNEIKRNYFIQDLDYRLIIISILFLLISIFLLITYNKKIINIIEHNFLIINNLNVFLFLIFINNSIVTIINVLITFSLFFIILKKSKYFMPYIILLAFNIISFFAGIIALSFIITNILIYLFKLNQNIKHKNNVNQIIRKGEL